MQHVSTIVELFSSPISSIILANYCVLEDLKSFFPHSVQKIVLRTIFSFQILSKQLLELLLVMNKSSLKCYINFFGLVMLCMDSFSYCATRVNNRRTLFFSDCKHNIDKLLHFERSEKLFYPHSVQKIILRTICSFQILSKQLLEQLLVMNKSVILISLSFQAFHKCQQ